ncbi:hypothetical protein M951_chr1124 (nucleomorph) [Lotharella oceanica]|uniref:Uncharacterized protein n=2 Tax=Lotharella oceanica TaxID=641309 RepID=A0A060DAR6_9EUKA|nr:hypothetical protein M951_chr1124 [Lotharella oceanica]
MLIKNIMLGMRMKKLLLINIKDIYIKKNIILFFIKNLLQPTSINYILIKNNNYIFYNKLFINLKTFFTIQIYIISETNNKNPNTSNGSFIINKPYINKTSDNNHIFYKLLINDF